MKVYKILLTMILVAVFIAGCSKLDTKEDILLTQENLESDYRELWGLGYAAYTRLQHGFKSIDDNIFAAVTDEAEQTASSSEAQLFNQGTWNAFNNPDDVYKNDYEGIRAANFFLENSVNYQSTLYLNRDTLSDNGRQYRLDLADIRWLRNENRVLRAYYYFDLLKRYGGVPLVTHTLASTDNTDLPRAGFDDVVHFIVSEIDAVRDSLQVNWKMYDASVDGRMTKAVALSIKARTLLYAASPLHNTANDPAKWVAAAQAAREVIALNQFSLHNNYRNLFVDAASATSAETIWAIRLGASNQMESKNYPIGTPGGAGGVTPTQNLVAAYEYKGVPDPSNPYANRDPRLDMSIACNNSTWNGRQLEIWPGGKDDHNRTNASRTGYYLKKFLNDNLNLVQHETKLRSWIVFRYAEILLIYAEAMNEAFGPDESNGWELTARQAMNMVRNRSGVSMPSVDAGAQAEMRVKIKQERRIELAFEDHRYWDLIRWGDAASVLNQPIKGIRVIKNTDSSFTYSEFTVENRVFIAPQMNYYPIPYSEIARSDKIMRQNPGW